MPINVSHKADDIHRFPHDDKEVWQSWGIIFKGVSYVILLLILFLAYVIHSKHSKTIISIHPSFNDGPLPIASCTWIPLLYQHCAGYSTDFQMYILNFISHSCTG